MNHVFTSALTCIPTAVSNPTTHPGPADARLSAATGMVVGLALCGGFWLAAALFWLSL